MTETAACTLHTGAWKAVSLYMEVPLVLAREVVRPICASCAGVCCRNDVEVSASGAFCVACGRIRGRVSGSEIGRACCRPRYGGRGYDAFFLAAFESWESWELGAAEVEGNDWCELGCCNWWDLGNCLVWR